MDSPKINRHLALLLGLLLVLGLFPAAVTASLPAPVDRVVVHKAMRVLYLVQGERVVRSYPVSLGKNPVGPKRRLGDQRTPEGRYLLDWRNPESRFYRAMHISYPSAGDRAAAARQGLHPGGSIMLHGLPDKYADGAEVMLDTDWTDGCIAVSNQAMDEIWQLVADNTVIEILP